MAPTADCSDEELPELNTLLKRPVRGRVAQGSFELVASRSRQKQDVEGHSTTGKRRVRRLESTTTLASSHLLRQWDPARDGIVFAPSTSSRTGSKKVTGEAVPLSPGLEDSQDTATLQWPRTGPALANKQPTTRSANPIELRRASDLLRVEAKVARPKTKATSQLDADDSNESSSDACPTTDGEVSSEYQNSDQSDSPNDDTDTCQHLAKPRLSRASRVPREVSKQQKEGLTVDRRKLSTEPRRPSHRGPSHRRVTHHTLDLADDLSKLRLPPDESSIEDHTSEATKNVKGPCLTPPRRKKSSGLNSPRKQIRIPETPHRPNADMFWSQEFVDDWNEQHSRRQAGHAEVSVTEKGKTGLKKETKKSFAARKDQIAQDFLCQLDNRITEGKLAELAAATGGIKIIWSKTLNTTAGRANWRRETVRKISASIDTQSLAEYKHHACIELAEKVIDEEERLFNVLAHEFCHLANFMINGITTNPHGKEFKAWAAKCSREFKAQGIHVTTKHTYEIDFKYIWACDACKAQYKRHSKSIDPSRHRCGSCKGVLTQIKPVPRGTGAGAKPSEYQTFMKEHMKIVRSENPGSPQKEIMKVVAERWSKRVGAKGSEASKTSEIVTQFVDLSLEDGQHI